MDKAAQKVWRAMERMRKACGNGLSISSSSASNKGMTSIVALTEGILGVLVNMLAAVCHFISG